MRNYLKVDDKNKRLIMDRMFDENRRIVGSKEYALLQMAKTDHPQYDVVLRHIKTNPEKKIYKNLTYTYMREYISKHPFAEARMKEFEEMTFRAKCHKRSYGNVKSWFLAAYPDISDFTPEQFKATQDTTETTIDNYELFEAGHTMETSLPLAS